MRLILFVLAFAYMIYAFLANHDGCYCDHDCESCPFPPCSGRIHRGK